MNHGRVVLGAVGITHSASVLRRRRLAAMSLECVCVLASINQIMVFGLTPPFFPLLDDSFDFCCGNPFRFVVRRFCVGARAIRFGSCLCN
jgi:hypothetical protein